MSDLDVGAAFQPRFAHSHQLIAAGLRQAQTGQSRSHRGLFYGNLDFPDKRLYLNCGAERHHYSMFDVGRSMFDVHLF